ncbi:MAG: hypothetical protein AAF740_07475 [Bacteroidota bacterium]
MRNLIASLIFCCSISFSALSTEGTKRVGQLVQVNGAVYTQDSEGKSLDTRLSIWCYETKQYEQRILQPNPSTGKFFALLASAQTYLIGIHPEGFRPYFWKLRVTEDMYSLALQQSFIFEEIEAFGQAIGQRATPTCHEERATYSHQLADSTRAQLKSKFMLDLIEGILEEGSPYGMDGLMPWIFAETRLDNQIPATSPEVALPEYEMLVRQIEATIRDTLTDPSENSFIRGVSIRKGELPMIQKCFFRDFNTTRSTLQDSTVLVQTLRVAGNKLRKEHDEILDKYFNVLVQNPSLRLYIHITKDESSPTLQRLEKRINKRLRREYELAERENPDFEFSNARTRYVCRLDLSQ